MLASATSVVDELTDDESSVLSEVGSVETEKSFSIGGYLSWLSLLSLSCESPGRLFVNFVFKVFLAVEDEAFDFKFIFDRFFLKKGMLVSTTGWYVCTDGMNEPRAGEMQLKYWIYSRVTQISNDQ